MNIMIGAPVRNRGWILPKYLKHIYNIDYPKDKIQLCFILNDSTDRSGEILDDFLWKHGKEYAGMTIAIERLGQVEDKRTSEVRQKIYHSLADLRNLLLESAVEKKVDYLLSVDSDILVPPKILSDLLANKKPIVSAQIWNDRTKNYPNIMIKQGDQIVHYLNFPKNSLFPCDVTGAVYLIRKDVLSSVRYEYHRQGEDVGFCLNAKEKGFSIWADSRIKCEHVMHRTL